MPPATEPPMLTPIAAVESRRSVSTRSATTSTTWSTPCPERGASASASTSARRSVSTADAVSPVSLTPRKVRASWRTSSGRTGRPNPGSLPSISMRMPASRRGLLRRVRLASERPICAARFARVIGPWMSTSRARERARGASGAGAIMAALRNRGTWGAYRPLALSFFRGRNKSMHGTATTQDQHGTPRRHHLRRGGTSVLVDSDAASLPVILHWGEDLGELTDEDVAAIVTASAPQRVSGGLDVPPRLTVLPQPSEGWFGSPGIAGHRGGADFSPALTARAVTQTDAQLVIEAEDPAAGLSAVITLA